MGAPQVEEFGPWLARQLRRADMTQAQLAERLNMTRAAVSAWVNNRAEPREEVRRHIADILGTDVASMHARDRDITMTRPVRWHHREGHLDGGREYGNAAAFAFGADLSVLAREATQNSIDEQFDTDKPVSVRYTLHELSGAHLDEFLDAVRWDDLRSHYEAAASTDQKVARSLRAALDDLAESGSLMMLRVDDYNAAGLTGPEYETGRYAAVVRRQLDSFKQSGGRAGGSYGLGKATLWATSRFGLVLVNSTLSTPYEGRDARRVVGRLDLPWREVDGKAYAGPAWFGESDTDPEHQEVSRSWWADETTVRSLLLERTLPDPGTSFLIVGAHDASGDAGTLQEMHDKLVRSLADGFWAAMVSSNSRKPIVDARVTTLRNGQVQIPEERVDPHVYHPALSRALRAYLNGETVEQLSSAEQVAQTDVPLKVPPLREVARGSKGCEHSAVLLVTAAADQDVKTNRVVFMRGPRMTVTDHRPRDLPIGATPFQAVLLAGFATGRDTDDIALAEQFLRASEPPEHDKWDRTEELTTLYQRGALSRLQEFRTEIDRAVRRLVGRREQTTGVGPTLLRELLKLDGTGQPLRRRQHTVPMVHNVHAQIGDDGAWQVRVEVRLPASDDPWLLTPVAKFDVRSGGRPSVAWRSITAAENCTVDGAGNLAIEAGVRAAAFGGVTDPESHPVNGKFARLVMEIHKTRGGAI